MALLRTSVLASLLSTAAFAQAPKVVTDIAPVHSLVAQVMEGIGAPVLLVEPTASPHHYALRPSQGAALESADLVFWVGEGLTPWLHDTLETLAAKAERTQLMEAEGTTTYAFRGDHDHDDHEDHKDHDDAHGHEGHDDHDHDKHDHDDHDGHKDHDDHAHEGHDDHDHDEKHAGHDDHEEHEGHAHAEGDIDPHGWLAPANAKAWLDLIARELAEHDPANAEAYKANAAAAQAKLDAQVASISAKLAPVQGRPYMVAHDAFQYFDQSFGLTFAGSIALGDAAAPSPARVAAARETLKGLDVHCVFTEPQQSDKLVRVVIEGTEAKTAVIDALGAGFAPGPDLYSDVLDGMAQSFASCLGD